MTDEFKFNIGDTAVTKILELREKAKNIVTYTPMKIQKAQYMGWDLRMRQLQDQVLLRLGSLADHMHTRYKRLWQWSKEQERQASQDQRQSIVNL